jgi:hypothetical protein
MKRVTAAHVMMPGAQRLAVATVLGAVVWPERRIGENSESNRQFLSENSPHQTCRQAVLRFRGTMPAAKARSAQ